MAQGTITLEVAARETSSSRATRRLRRSGLVPGIVYGGGEDAITFQVEVRELRHALTHGGALLDLKVDGGQATPVVVKDRQRNVVTGETIHVDLLRVRLDKPIDAIVILHLVGGEESPGAKEGGVLEQIARELNISALPAAIPEEITFDVSGLSIGDTVTLSAVTAPEGVTLLDDLEETVIAIMSAPRLQAELEELDAAALELETELVGEEGEAPAEGEDAAEGEGEGGDEDEPEGE